MQPSLSIVSRRYWNGRGRDIAITEGPVDWGRRMTCFLRDPDSNVLDFNELKSDGGIGP
jgi:hypothetical protein